MISVSRCVCRQFPFERLLPLARERGWTLADVMRAIEGPLAAVRDIRPEQLSYEGAAEVLPDVWVAVRAALRNVMRQTGCGDTCGLCRPYLRRMLTTGETVFHELLSE